MADNLTKDQRSRCMSRIKGKDTGIELTVDSELRKRGLRFRKHAAHLPGKPDFAFPRKKVAVFVDGDFWHGYRLPRWRNTLSPFWLSKIEGNIRRDKRNFARLRRMGWTVIRLWGHQVHSNLEACVERIENLVS